jgi:glycosyltransferase involved in cell wall biosynthesis
MITSNRREFILKALQCYLSQDFIDKELIVVDDGSDHVDDLVNDVASIYYHPGVKLTVGEKRNLACTLAKGEYIVHWDDDDWSAPHRLSEEFKMMEESKKPVVGYKTMLFYDAALDKAWLYMGSDGFALGTSLFYKKVYWEQHKFSPKNLGEDHDFTIDAMKHFGIYSKEVGLSMVALLHDRNTSPHDLTHQQFPSYPVEQLPPAFLEVYR